MSGKLAVLGIISGALCAAVVFAFTISVQAQADSERAAALERFGGEQVEVCVATRDIAPGETISTANVATRAWVADLLPDQPLTMDEAQGKIATSSIVSGEVLCAKRFSESTEMIEVPEGLCAVSLPAEDVNAVGGAIERGSKVDVYLAGASSTTPLATEVLVLATSAGSASGSGKKISWITVAVEAERVAEFVSAAEQGNLYYTIPGEKKGA